MKRSSPPLKCRCRRWDGLGNDDRHRWATGPQAGRCPQKCGQDDHKHEIVLFRAAPHHYPLNTSGLVRLVVSENRCSSKVALPCSDNPPVGWSGQILAVVTPIPLTEDRFTNGSGKERRPAMPTSFRMSCGSGLGVDGVASAKVRRSSEDLWKGGVQRAVRTETGTRRSSSIDAHGQRLPKNGANGANGSMVAGCLAPERYAWSCACLYRAIVPVSCRSCCLITKTDFQ